MTVLPAHGSASGITPADGNCYPTLTFTYTSPLDFTGSIRGPFDISLKLSAQLGGTTLQNAWQMTVNAGMQLHVYWFSVHVC